MWLRVWVRVSVGVRARVRVRVRVRPWLAECGCKEPTAPRVM